MNSRHGVQKSDISNVDASLWSSCIIVIYSKTENTYAIVLQRNVYVLGIWLFSHHVNSAWKCLIWFYVVHVLVRIPDDGPLRIETCMNGQCVVIII